MSFTGKWKYCEDELLVAKIDFESSAAIIRGGEFIAMGRKAINGNGEYRLLFASDAAEKRALMIQNKVQKVKLRCKVIGENTFAVVNIAYPVNVRTSMFKKIRYSEIRKNEEYEREKMNKNFTGSVRSLGYSTSGQTTKVSPTPNKPKGFK